MFFVELHIAFSTQKNIIQFGAGHLLVFCMKCILCNLLRHVTVTITQKNRGFLCFLQIKILES